MYRATKSKGGRRSTSVVLKNDAVSVSGQVNGISHVTANAIAHSPSTTRPPRRPSRRACCMFRLPRLTMIEIVT